MQNHIVYNSTIEMARTFIPGWLHHALERVTSNESASERDAIRPGCVLPSFDGAELAFLALLLSELQIQFLRTDVASPVLKISMDHIQKLTPRADFGSRDKILRVFEALSQLRMLVPKNSDELSAFKLFGEESWGVTGQYQNSSVLSLPLMESTGEVLCGYVDAHFNLVRSLSGEASIKELLCSLNPLVIWTPVWLELTLPEQLLYLRMEALMQTHGSWMRLDGLTGASIEALSRGLRVPKRAPALEDSQESSHLLEQLRLFGRLGRRLVAHGVIKKMPAHGFTATGSYSTSEAPLLLWQATAERLRSNAEGEFLGLVGRRILLGHSNKQITNLLRIFAGISSDKTLYLSRLKEIWQIIRDEPGSVYVAEPGVLVQSHFLFLEWISRAGVRAQLPLPKSLVHSDIYHALSDVCAANAAQRFKKFCQILSEKQWFFAPQQDNSTDVPHSISCIEAHGGMHERLSLLLKEESHAVQDPCSFGLERHTSVSSIKAPRAQSAENDAPQDCDSAIKPAVFGQKLHKLASQELEKMIRQSPDCYRTLKQKYISSLDLETRTLVLNVQRRLDSRAFDLQLRTRLVRFMIDNPASWTSPSSALLV